MIPVSIHITDKDYHVLKPLSSKKGISLSALIEWIVWKFTQSNCSFQVVPDNPFAIDDPCKSDWKPTDGPEIPKKSDGAVLVSTFGITTMAWVVSEPSEKLKFTILDPINHQAVYDPLDKYQVRKWMPLPKGD